MRSRVRFNATDIWDAPEDGNRYEVIDGELFVTPAPDWLHQSAVSALHGYIWQYVQPRRLGWVRTAPIAVVLDEETGIEPDIVYVSQERSRIISARGIEGAPDLVVEVLSPSTKARDRGLKMRRYAAAGVPHYWIVDPSTRSLEAYRLGESGYELIGVFGPGSIFRPALFPSLEILIDDLWA
jgi:Uma2 family endonuclease